MGALDQIEARTVPHIKQDPHALFAYVFGSLAKGTGHPKSDIDIAVFFSGIPNGAAGDIVATRDQVERNFEVCIQACIDLGAHILADFPHAQPDTDAEVFRLLAKEGIIASELADLLRQMVGFRNLLVHAHADILDARVHHNLGQLGDIQAYVEQVAPYLERQGVF